MPATSRQRICRHCTEAFTDDPDAPRGHWSRFCSQHCRSAARIAAANRKVIRSFHGRVAHNCAR